MDKSPESLDVSLQPSPSTAPMLQLYSSLVNEFSFLRASVRLGPRVWIPETEKTFPLVQWRSGSASVTHGSIFPCWSARGWVCSARQIRDRCDRLPRCAFSWAVKSFFKAYDLSEGIGSITSCG
ncbi:hypothetical protein AVEN_228073-1 [Araneus ventricosus]|uniref:Uncharacterized protein n=1 Tax=Araneus ventricosus TaxID=182803 RepID=A0A4Y2F6T5_ARAVE|nr:hypothetical protein AVEN_228073-1 [Araneus ventricosus]